MTGSAGLTIDDAIADPMLLGGALGDLESWAVWRAVLKAAFCIPMSDADTAAFASVSGGRKPPTRRVDELWAVAGRRGGKSRTAAVIGTYIAALENHAHKLAPGETGYVLVLSPSKSQARAVHDYCEGFLTSSPILAKQLDGDPTAEEIRLKGNIIIGVHTNSYRTVRGRTLLACVFDESAYWRDESSASPDVETYRAVIPALATTGGMLVGISSPYRRLGLLHTKHRDHFGKDDDEVLVVQGGTATFNPCINTAVVDRARRNDPEAARAEWDAEFRNDLSALLDDAVIDAAIDHSRPLDLPYRHEFKYCAFVDASAGRHDHFTMCIGHREDERFVADVIRGARPPFDPNGIAAEYADLARSYGCDEITGDNFAGDWTVRAFENAGIAYARAEKPKSALYLEAVPWFMRNAILIPNHPRLIRELRLLERRVAPSGKDRVDHGQGGSDDYANALVGAMQLAADPYEPAVATVGRWCRVPDSEPGVFDGRAYAQIMQRRRRLKGR